MKNKILGSIFCFLMPFTAWSGTGTRGGGDIDPIGMNETQIRDFVQFHLKDQLSEYLDQLNIVRVEDPVLQKKLLILKSGIAADLTSPYTLLNRCTDAFDQSHEASTLNGVKGAVICFDVSKLVRAQVNSSELIALAVHEHARHFSLEDESSLDSDNPIFQYVVEDFKLLMFQERIISSLLNSSEFLQMKLEVGGASFWSAKVVKTSLVRPPLGPNCALESWVEVTFMNQKKYEINYQVQYESGPDCSFRKIVHTQISFRTQG